MGNGRSGPRHHCTRPAPRDLHPAGPLKGDRSDPRPPRHGAPQGNPKGSARAQEGGPRPATFPARMPEPKRPPKAAAHASLPLSTCPKTNRHPGASSRSNSGFEELRAAARSTGQARMITPGTRM
jgi:hypothetical protein